MSQNIAPLSTFGDGTGSYGSGQQISGINGDTLFIGAHTNADPNTYREVDAQYTNVKAGDVIHYEADIRVVQNDGQSKCIIGFDIYGVNGSLHEVTTSDLEQFTNPAYQVPDSTWVYNDIFQHRTIDIVIPAQIGGGNDYQSGIPIAIVPWFSAYPRSGAQAEAQLQNPILTINSGGATITIDSIVNPTDGGVIDTFNPQQAPNTILTLHAYPNPNFNFKQWLWTPQNATNPTRIGTSTTLQFTFPTSGTLEADFQPNQTPPPNPTPTPTGCFIATAAGMTPTELTQLRKIRDLISNFPDGKALVDFYYAKAIQYVPLVEANPQLKQDIHDALELILKGINDNPLLKKALNL